MFLRKVSIFATNNALQQTSTMRKNKNRKAGYYTHTCPRYTSRQIRVPLELVKLEDNSYHLIIPVEIDGIQGDMIIDTGASVTVVDQEMFPLQASENKGLQIQSGSVTGEIENVRIIRANYFMAGGKKIKNFRFAGISLKYVNQMYHRHLNRKIIGLLGCDFCVRHRVVIDYHKRELTMTF